MKQIIAGDSDDCLEKIKCYKFSHSIMTADKDKDIC